ncbi:hypothetical protein GIB67_037946 [Kingdonia uniflora]|uniref:Uncharacterized protein n=1 Tax=Kingdonia uniflora TaxID=39325 RepID=A0A7J7LHE6_9MAGN|nr:hypothetical protein GIB67_037946 [Kingdonia uniflora]
MLKKNSAAADEAFYAEIALLLKQTPPNSSMARRVSLCLSQNLLLSKLIPNQSSSLHQRSIKAITNLPMITPSTPPFPSPSHPKHLFFTPRFFCSSNAEPQREREVFVELHCSR